jgi:ketosteroid isomerase-like protein
MRKVGRNTRHRTERTSIMTQPTTATTPRTDAEILGGALQALAAGDVPTVLAALSDDITWHVSGRNPLSGDYRGHAEVVGFFQALGERCNGTFRLDVHDILDSGSGAVVALVTERAERDGAQLADSAVHLWRFEGGKATSFRAFTGDEHAQDAFWV